MLSFARLFGILFFLASLMAIIYYLESPDKVSYQNYSNYSSASEKVIINDFLQLVRTADKNEFKKLIDKIDSNWKEDYEILLLETIYFSNNIDNRSELASLFARKTRQSLESNFDAWFQYIWNKKASYPPNYFNFKAKLHQSIDAKFYKYFFNRQDENTIRLDEVRWGGVLQDGIPPLRNPKMITAANAGYLEDTNIVFGIEVNGDARAYPKRILAWHEMFVDTVGGVPVAGVYCTLCGTIILYKTEHNGQNYQLGTSGFLYRSNKLMYVKGTQSLWSTLEGKPVIGPLVDKGIELEYLSVVTTTWGEWKERHPETSVLSLNTGHKRDYREGKAYQSYFSTDDLMFTIPKIDSSLNNKDEILSIRLPKVNENIAISSKFLQKSSIYHSEIAETSFVVFTDASGAHRVYFTNGLKFKQYDNGRIAYDNNGKKWTLQEGKMISEHGKELKRFPSHNAFWFGYKAAFPNTKLIH